MALEDVTYFVKTAPAAPTAGDLVEECALQRATDKDDAPLVGGVGKRQTTVWHLDAAKLSAVSPAIVPKAGDVILDARGVRWTVASEKLQTVKTRWRLACVREN